jgi:hypothetical protein
VSDDEKKLQNEILPDPSQAETDLTAGGPRRRTIEHLKRILATAGTGLALQGPAVACAQDAGSPGGATSKPADAGRQDRPTPPPTPPPEPPSYGVVDPIPYPAQDPEAPRPGKLRLISKPEAEIIVDGEATGKRTPHRLRLNAGSHTITLRAGAVEQTFTVEIESGKTVTEKRDLRPAATKKAGGDQTGK